MNVNKAFGIVFALFALFILTVAFNGPAEKIEVGKWYWTQYQGNFYQCKVMKGPERNKYLVLVDHPIGDKYDLRHATELYFRLGDKREQLENE